jgi:hypothetical protein
VLLVDTPSLKWSLGEGRPSLVLSSGSNTPISKTETLYFKSDGWPDETAARAAAKRYTAALARTLARLRIGVDFGARAPAGGGFSSWMIDKFLQEHGVRVINEAPGVMIFETEPPYVFGGASGSFQRGIHAEQFEDIFSTALLNEDGLGEDESVSMTLFNASFFEESQDARFMMLNMALEALIRPAPRSEPAIAHVDQMLNSTMRAVALTQSERDALCGALSGLRCESIGQAGRALIREKLGARRYGGMSAVDLFSLCYSLRSRLVHGTLPLPTRDEISSAAASLEMMMSDLLAGRLRDSPLPAGAG